MKRARAVLLQASVRTCPAEGARLQAHLSSECARSLQCAVCAQLLSHSGPSACTLAVAVSFRYFRARSVPGAEKE
ncbi:hypothetical protein NDU88_001670 [Pleurodeles waltl]|uniref:Uncharacterized protein n=1 Tax=Pleurodeles waltl TaxID=8319 RepID=A0AAV7U7V6_PLEWA|nr:hypothetical protein NDU88_001670 [Pleurodeles waltl]